MTNKGILSINAHEPHEIIMSLSVIEGKIEGGIICPPPLQSYKVQNGA